MTSTVTAGHTGAASNTDPVGPADQAGLIDTLRGQIDQLDQAIIDLVRERAAVSAKVQAARIAAGGTRLELGRERLILDHFRRDLGRRGPALADVLLRICRGER
jgi:chorismate mutase